ncbi:MAG: hypothetical protein LBF88_02740 [Planctomycetaceae bacterium]|jgi:hypothetical protein|nr:hypothetical protein [Planctomycetaceae bacterium]
MIENTPENRQTITGYLESTNEDTFIDEFITPFYSSHGYYLYRINSHGPGEGGKDLIFYRNVPIFYDNEYIAIQAKAQSITTSNVVEIVSQLTRALYLPFSTKSGNGTTMANYAILINARKINNEANDTICSFISKNPNIKILAQENVCELIIKTGIAPSILLEKLSKYIDNNEDSSTEDRHVLSILLNNNSQDIELLFNVQLQVLKTVISDKIKGLVIEYIFNYWDNDPTWSGTVKPMKWLNKYFDFIQPPQYNKLMKVFNELTSLTPSFAAQSDTYSISRKITTTMVKSFLDEFIRHCCVLVLYYKNNTDISILLGLLKNLKNDDELGEQYRNLVNDILNLYNNGPKNAKQSYINVMHHLGNDIDNDN